MNRFDLHRKHPAACLHAVGLDEPSSGTRLLSLSTIAGTKISNPPWVNFQSAGWVSFQSAPTHSPHVANAASFEAVRYFLSSSSRADNVRRTKIKDFRKGLAAIKPEDRDFLHQYMTLTKCDLYFADKAILVEGTTERILMPRICRIVDEGLPAASKLVRQYLTTIEVGGAYANIFYPLLDFLELKSLIITDLDAVYRDETVKPAKWKKCPCSQGTRTSNAAIKAWFEVGAGQQISLQDLATKTATDKMKGYRRVAFQIPEDGSQHCARSYEDALILANPERFDLPKDGDLAQFAWDLAQDFPKADTALRFAIKEVVWNVPLYIREGLIWLAELPPPPNEPPPVDPGARAVETSAEVPQ